jgi:plastocyanin
MNLNSRAGTIFAAAVLANTFAVVATLSGCKADSASQHAESMGKVSDRPAAPPTISPTANVGPDASTPQGPTGNVSGTVSFAGTPPKFPAIDTAMDPACSLGKATSTLPVEQIQVTKGKLANVFVFVKSGPPAAMQAGPTSSQPVVMDQQGCRYVPHVIGVLAGGYVEFRNSDPTMHNIHTMPTDVGNETIDVSMGPRGQAMTKQFAKPELMIPVRCNNHPWMNAFINVSATPFFSVSDANGHFDLHGLPTGEYTLGAVQEKLGEQDLHVTVQANGTATAGISFSAK